MSRRIETALATAISITLLSLPGCQQQPQSISQPPIPAPRARVSETPGNTSTQPVAGLNDPATLEARIRQLVGELETAQRNTPESPRISTPPTIPAEPPTSITVSSPTPTPSPTPSLETAAPPPTLSPSEPPAILAALRDTPTPTPTIPTPTLTTTTPETPLAANQSIAITPSPPSPTPLTTSPQPPSASPLDSSVAARLAKDPRDASAHLDSAILAYLREQPSPDPAGIADLPQEDREVVSAVIDSLVNFRAVTRSSPNAMYASRVRPFAELSDRLRLRSELSVPSVVMASKVDSFGVYEPMPQVLSPRAETVTIIYTEVANFTSRLTDKRLWETRLAGEMGLYDQAGKLVWQFRPPNTLDLCRNRRTDFCVSYVVRIPPQPPGRYILKVGITDLNVQRVAEGILPLESK